LVPLKKKDATLKRLATVIEEDEQEDIIAKRTKDTMSDSE
jgi:hypothetical protein